MEHMPDQPLSRTAAELRCEVRRIPVIRDVRLVGVIAQADIAVSKDISRKTVGEVVRTISESAQPMR